MSSLLEKLKAPKPSLQEMMAPQQRVDVGDLYNRFKEAIVKDEDLIFTIAQNVVDDIKKLDKGEDGLPGNDGHTPTEDELMALITPLIPAIAQKAATMIRTPKDGDPGKSIKGDMGPAPIPGKHYYSKSQIEELIARAVAEKMPKTLGAVKEAKAPDLSGLASKEEIEKLKEEIKKWKPYKHGGGSSVGGGGGGGGTLLTTQTPNGVIVAFTFTAKPRYIVSDGIEMRENFGWTWSGVTATLSVPPTYDIYGKR